MDKNSRILVTGHRGMVGSAVLRLLQREGYTRLLTIPREEVDLRNQSAVAGWFTRAQPEVVFLLAARVGGIKANMTWPAEFLYDNLMIQSNVIHQCHLHDVRKLVYLGSSCIYPRDCPQPMKEEYLLTGPLEPTNEGYALAKIAGLKMVQTYSHQYGLPAICPMPCNLYGTNDHFDPAHAHVLSSLVKRFVDAADEGRPEVTLWGTGKARREFLHVDDCAEALLFLLDRHSSPDLINVGTGTDVTIRELAARIVEATGYRGEIRWDATMPDGMLRKCMDVSRMTALGYRPKISLEEGIARTVEEYRRLKAQGAPA